MLPGRDKEIVFMKGKPDTLNIIFLIDFSLLSTAELTNLIQITYQEQASRPRGVGWLKREAQEGKKVYVYMYICMYIHTFLEMETHSSILAWKIP